MEERKMTDAEKISFLNKKVDEEAQEQEENLVADYDAVLREYKEQNKPYYVKFKGKRFAIPHSMPFNFGLFYMRNCIKKRQGKTMFEIPEDKLSEFIEKMFGTEFLETLNQSDDVELEFVLGRLIPDIFEKWGYDIKNPQKNE